MNYKGIVDWLQEDDFVLMGFSKRGEVALMEKLTGKEVNDLPAFLIATVLPIAKKKITHLVMEAGYNLVCFEETFKDDKYLTSIHANGLVVSIGEGETFEYATVSAIENYIRKEQEKSNDKG